MGLSNGIERPVPTSEVGCPEPMAAAYAVIKGGPCTPHWRLTGFLSSGSFCFNHVSHLSGRGRHADRICDVINKLNLSKLIYTSPHIHALHSSLTNKGEMKTNKRKTKAKQSKRGPLHLHHFSLRVIGHKFTAYQGFCGKRVLGAGRLLVRTCCATKANLHACGSSLKSRV